MQHLENKSKNIFWKSKKIAFLSEDIFALSDTATLRYVGDFMKTANFQQILTIENLKIDESI